MDYVDSDDDEGRACPELWFDLSEDEKYAGCQTTAEKDRLLAKMVWLQSDKKAVTLQKKFESALRAKKPPSTIDTIRIALHEATEKAFRAYDVFNEKDHLVQQERGRRARVSSRRNSRK
jgi:hypothetical protein